MFPSLRAALHRRQHPQRYQWLEELNARQLWSREALLAWEGRAFSEIVAHARATTPYYAARLVDPRQPPILTKDDVRRHLDDLLSSSADRAQARLGHTGGSTGQPLAFWYDEAKHELMRAGMMRGFMMSGWRPGQKVLYLWGARHDTARGGVFAGGLGDWIAAEKTIAAVEYSEAALDQWARTLRRWRPVLLYGYASALHQLARHLLARGQEAPDSLLGAYSTAEMLDQEQRQVMERAFGCKVFNQYGCREVPNIAWECRHGGLHVFADLVHLESLEGRLLVTSLSNRQMPFIRYELGDSGRLLDGTCPCGSPFPLMEMDLCRKNDLIRVAGGRTLHPSLFNRLLYGHSEIRQYQWVQQSSQRMELLLVADTPLEQALQGTLAERLRREADPGLELVVRQVAEIPRTASGKHRFIIGLDPG